MNKCQTEPWNEPEVNRILVSRTKSCNTSKRHYKS